MAARGAFPIGLVTALMGASAVVAFATPQQVQAVDFVDVTVTIMKFEVLEDSDPAPGQGVSDVYARVGIGANPKQNNEGSQIESLQASPYWTFTRQVDRDLADTTTVSIELLDDDTGLAAPDDVLDIDADDNDLDLNLSVDLFDATWTGEVAPNTGFSVGDGDTEHSGLFEGGEPVRVWFDVTVGSDGDIDDDGIPDGVERFGIRNASGAVTTDMAALGADPCRKTIAIESDWLQVPGAGGHSHQPSTAGIAEAVAMMNAAPFPAVSPCPYAGFPQQTSGINLVVDVNQGIDVAADVDDNPYGIAQLDAQRATNFDADREPYFFYNVWAHTHDGSSSSGVCCSGKKGFMVTLGNWAGQNGNTRDQSGTFLHELGHNIGLPHGGSDGVNYKPNYLSIMNYRYQVIGIPNWDVWAAAGFAPNQLIASSTLDFSRSALPTLDETNLAEPAGIADGNAAAYWRDPTFTLRAGDTRLGLDFNWNSNGVTATDTGLSQDLNEDGACVSAGDDGVLNTTAAGDDVVMAGRVMSGPNRTCNTTAAGDDDQDQAVGFVQPANIIGFDDWSNIKFLGAMSPDAGSVPAHSSDEVTFEEAEQIKFEASIAANQPPVADAGGPYAVDEGSAVQLDGTASIDPDGDLLTYSWSPTTHLDTPSSATPNYSGVDDTVDVLTLTVTDPGGLDDSDSTTVTVDNVDPDVTVVGDAIDEGGVADISATFDDPGVLDTHTATIDWGDDTPVVPVSVVQASGSGSIAASHPYGDNGTYTVTVTVTDDDGGVGSNTGAVIVANVDPEAEIDTGDAVTFPGGDALVGQVGEIQQFDATATDAGSDDLTFTWNFGESNTYFNNGIGPDPLPSPLGTYPFAASDAGEVTFDTPGVESIGVVITDDDGGSDADLFPAIITGDADMTFGNGYWKHEFSGNGSAKAPADWLDGYLEIVRFTSDVFAETTPLSTHTQANAVLSPSGGDKRAVARADLLAAWLHFASGAVEWDAIVPLGGNATATYLEVMAKIESVILDPTSTKKELQDASALAQPSARPTERADVAKAPDAPTFCDWLSPARLDDQTVTELAIRGTAISPASQPHRRRRTLRATSPHSDARLSWAYLPRSLPQ